MTLQGFAFGLLIFIAWQVTAIRIELKRNKETTK